MLSGDGIEVSYELVKVFVWPEKVGYQNVVGRVKWNIRFQRNGYESLAYIETDFDPDQIDNFVPIEQVNSAVIFNWALKREGGSNFLAVLKEHHSRRLDQLELRGGQVEYMLGS